MNFGEIYLFFGPVKKMSSVKNIKISLFSSREKENQSVKNPKVCPWKLLTARENVSKSVRESQSSFREKSQKKAKNGFHGHFWFSREKKTLGWVVVKS